MIISHFLRLADQSSGPGLATEFKSQPSFKFFGLVVWCTEKNPRSCQLLRHRITCTMRFAAIWKIVDLRSIFKLELPSCTWVRPSATKVEHIPRLVRVDLTRRNFSTGSSKFICSVQEWSTTFDIDVTNILLQLHALLQSHTDQVNPKHLPSGLADTKYVLLMVS